MKTFLIVANSTKDENLILAGRVRDYIEMHGGNAQICVDGDNIPVDCKVDIAIVLGGDRCVCARRRMRQRTDGALRGKGHLGLVHFADDQFSDDVRA